MNDFYVRDVDFDSGYNPLQAPVVLSWAAAGRGFVPPDPGAPFAYCDLGCGNGQTVVALAAVHPQSRFVGVDFNAGHVEQARALARDAGVTNVEIHLASFTELHAKALPRFDYVAMNGIYSWLHPSVVDAVVRFLDARLAEDGLFVVEYLTLPGAASVAPMWKLLREIASHVDGGPLARAAAGLDALAELRRHNARYFVDNPRQAGHVERLHAARDDEQLLGWLAHSALADHWHPKDFTEVAGELGAAGLRFAGSPQLALNDVALSIPTALRAAFEPLRETAQVELLKDFALNRSQRTDVFSRGVPDPHAADAFQRERFCVAAGAVPDATAQAVGRIARALPETDRARCRALAAELSAAPVPLPVGRLGGDSRALAALLVTPLFDLRATGTPAPAAPARESAALAIPLDVNRIAVERAATAIAPTALVLPSGDCARLTGVEALALFARVRHEDDDARAALVRATLAAHDGPIVIGGQRTSADWIAPADVDAAIRDFDSLRLPVLARLGVVGPK